MFGKETGSVSKIDKIVVATDHSALAMTREVVRTLAQRWAPSAALKGEALLSRAQAQTMFASCLLFFLFFRRDRMDESSFARIEGDFPC
jgi:uncharacterized protein (DUF2267 family)